MYGWKHRLVMTASNLSNFSAREVNTCCSRKPFGENGNRYVRISLALDDQKLDEAAIRLTELAYLYE